MINETEGTLTEGEGEYDELHPRFAFVRDEEGDSFQAGAGTEIETENASRYLGDIPVFFLTGKNDRDSVMSVMSLKPDGYVIKTAGKQALLEKVNMFFSSRP